MVPQLRTGSVQWLPDNSGRCQPLSIRIGCTRFAFTRGLQVPGTGAIHTYPAQQCVVSGFCNARRCERARPNTQRLQMHGWRRHDALWSVDPKRHALAHAAVHSEGNAQNNATQVARVSTTNAKRRSKVLRPHHAYRWHSRCIHAQQHSVSNRPMYGLQPAGLTRSPHSA